MQIVGRVVKRITMRVAVMALYTWACNAREISRQREVIRKVVTYPKPPTLNPKYSSVIPNLEF